jgi:hypothetical protein
VRERAPDAAQRSSRCAADPGPTSHQWVPELRCTAKSAFHARLESELALHRVRDTSYFFVPLFTASSRLALAEPGRSGFGWLSCGAQADSQTMSKVVRMRPSVSAKRSE